MKFRLSEAKHTMSYFIKNIWRIIRTFYRIFILINDPDLADSDSFATGKVIFRSLNSQ
jgi:hypothetical protein